MTVFRPRLAPLAEVGVLGCDAPGAEAATIAVGFGANAVA